MIAPLYFKAMAFSKKHEQVHMRQMIKQSFQNKISIKFLTFVPFGVKQSDVIEAAAVFNFLWFYYNPESAEFYFIRASS